MTARRSTKLPGDEAAGAAVLAGALAVVAQTAAGQSSWKACSPPRGPGDNAIHSTNLRVQNLTCRTGRRVALRCTAFTYGKSGRCTAVGRRWHCTSKRVGGSESTQRCVTGRHWMHIRWLD